MKLEQFKTSEPYFILEDYFSGKTKAYGMFIDRFQNVKARFTVDIQGNWTGTTLVLNEDFIYDDGHVDKRIWRIQKKAEGHYEGNAKGVVGKAVGRTEGSALNWSYLFDLQTKKGKVRVKFDDWMFLQPGGVLLNIARIKKWGINLGTLFLSFRKL